MKFAAPYQLDFDCPIDHEKIDEFNIVFTKDSSFDELKKFIEMYPSHQINVTFIEKHDTDKITTLCNEFNNIYIRIRSKDFEYLPFYEENNINYIFDSTIPICNYSLLEWVLNCSVKGIYIADDLTYNLREVYNQCSKKNIQLRVVLNKVPVTNPLSLSCPTVQVYQPQNYDFLSQYYDVGEFECGNPYDWEKAKILYQKWFVEHDWDSDLKYMNQDLILPYPTKSIPPELTRMRSLCQHHCAMRATNLCSKCERLLLMGYRNAENNIIYQDIEHGLPTLEEMVDTILISKENNNK